MHRHAVHPKLRRSLKKSLLIDCSPVAGCVGRLRSLPTQSQRIGHLNSERSSQFVIPVSSLNPDLKEKTWSLTASRSSPTPTAGGPTARPTCGPAWGKALRRASDATKLTVRVQRSRDNGARTNSHPSKGYGAVDRWRCLPKAVQLHACRKDVHLAKKKYIHFGVVSTNEIYGALVSIDLFVARC